MEAKMDDLLSMLNDHIGRYEILADLLNQEQAALIDLDLPRLSQVCKTKENQVLKIKLQIQPLSRAIQDLAGQLGLPADPLPTLAELANAAPGPWSARLSRAGLALARVKRGIVSHNEANQAFVKEALQIFTGSIHILTGAAAVPKTGYQRPGRKTGRSDTGPLKLSREV